MPPLPIESATVTRQTITDNFTAVGTIDAINAVQIVSEINGKITALPFKEGSTISKGSIIAQLDDSQLRAERDRAEAMRDQRKAFYDRMKGVFDQNLMSKQDMDDATANYKIAEADFALAKAKLDKTQIAAPFTGNIGARLVSIGQFVLPGQAIASLAQTDQLKITFSAPERFAPLLHKGAPITVSSPALNQTLQGEIDVIEPIVSPATRSITIVAHLKNPEGLFTPGMSANVNAVLKQRDSALLIPSQAVIIEGTQMSIYIINADGTVSKTAVTLGSRTAGLVEVLSGISDGQQVVTAGYQKFGFMPPGFKVMSMPPQGAGGQAPAGEQQQSAPAATDSTAVDSAASGQTDTTTGDK
jgi:membrane fusion protein (multidrug efflux system)